MRYLGLLLVLAITAPVDAAPAADLVVVWAPGMRTTPVEQAAKGAGAAVIDRSPAPPGAINNAQTVQRGIQAFERLELDDAWKTLEQARSDIDRDGGAGLTRAQLSDLFLYRGLVKIQQGDTSAAWEELIAANTIDPTRQLDPGRFPPLVRSEFERARTTVKNKERAKVTFKTPPGCRTMIDGTSAIGDVELIVGRHWYRVVCPDRQPEGAGTEIRAGKTDYPIEPAPYAPPTDTDLIVQARAAGARAFVVAEVRSNVATARLVGLDGRERDRRTVSIAGDLSPLADAVASLLSSGPKTHWYQTKWAWAVGGGALAAAILVPLTVFLARDTASPDLTVKAPGPPGWDLPQ